MIIGNIHKAILNKCFSTSTRKMARLNGNSMIMWFLFAIMFGLGNFHASAELQRLTHAPKNDDSLSFLVLGDWGRKGDYNQSDVAYQV